MIKDSIKILEESYAQQEFSAEDSIQEAESIKSEAKIISEDGSIHLADPEAPEAEVLKAGERVLDLINEKINKDIEFKNKEILKHKRPRADSRGAKLLLNNTNEIATPLLEQPQDLMIEEKTPKPDPTPSKDIPKEVKPPIKKETDSNTDQKPDQGAKKIKFSLLSKIEQEKLSSKKQKQQEALTSYFRQASKAVSSKPTPKNKKGKRNKPKRLIAVSVLMFIVGLSVLIFYVNSFAIKEEYILKNMGKRVSFDFERPADIPEGYQLSYLSESDNNFIKYYYTFDSDYNRYLSIKIEPTEIKSDEIFDKIIKNQKANFSQTTEGGLEFWQINDHQVYVVKDKLLYTFESSSEMLTEKLLEFTKETVL